MNQFRIPNRLKAIKKTISGLFLIKLEISHFSYQGSVKYRPPLQSNENQ